MGVSSTNARNRAEQLHVLNAFVTSMNKRLKASGMGDMQMKLHRDGSVDDRPSAPRGVRAVDMGAEGVALLWSKARDDGAIKGYKIYRDGKLIKTVRGSQHYIDPKGNAGAKYEIKAIDEAGNVGVAGSPGSGGKGGTQKAAQAGSPMDPAVAAKAPRTGTAPKLLGVKGAGPGQFQLQWEKVDGAIGYGVFDGDRLLGHVKGTSFKGVLSKGASSALRIDAVRADGTRTPLTSVVGLRLGEQGIEVDKSMAAEGAASATAQPDGAQPAAQAGAAPAEAAAAAAPAEAAPAEAAPAEAAAAPASGAPAGVSQEQANQAQQAARAASRPMR